MVANFAIPSQAQDTGHRVRKVPDNQRPVDIVTSFHRKAVDSSEYPWKAVGRVNIGGTAHCTGSLIATNIVLTAAHCLYSKRLNGMVPASIVHFLAGYAHGKYSAHSKVIAYQTGEGFDGSTGANTKNMPHDWALLILQEPLGETHGIIPLHEGFKAAVGTGLTRPTLRLSTSQIAVAGYPRDRSHVLSLEENCKISNAFNRGAVLVTNCIALQGDSGGPILQPINGSWTLLGLQTASAKRGHTRYSIGVSGLAFMRAFSALMEAQNALPSSDSPPAQ